MNSGGVVSVSASANSGYQFGGFSGALSGTTSPQNLTMSGPESVTASFNSTGTSPYVTTYSYDLYDNLSQVSMPRPTGTQTRTFTYSGPYLQNATNPENGTVTYTYNSYNKVHTKTDAKGQVAVYTYDTYARLIEVQRYPQGTNNPEDTTQRETYYYDTNPFDSTYSNNISGRLAAVQYSGPDAYGTAGATTYTEMYNYNQGGGMIGKRLRIQRTYVYYYDNGTSEGDTTSYVDLDGVYTYDNEGRITGIQYPLSGPNLTWTFDSMGRLNGMIKNAGGYVVADRLGSIGHFYPYGLEKPSATTNGTEKFTGYLRDGETGMDYADQRYHVPGTGRFLTPDPYKALTGGGADLLNPGTWNLYAYSGGDPVNRADPKGHDYTDFGCPQGDLWSDVDGGWDCETNYDPGDNPSNWSGSTCTSVVEVDCVADDGAVVDNGTLVNGTSVTVSDSTGDNDTNPSSVTVQSVNTSPSNPGAAQNPCTPVVLNAVNQRFGTNLTTANVQNGFMNGGAWNLVINASNLPATQFNSIQTGRSPNGFLGAVTGYGPSLHIAGPALLDPTAIFTNSNIGGVTSVTFTAHLDSAWAGNPVGALIHLFTDVLGKNTRNHCPN